MFVAMYLLQLKEEKENPTPKVISKRKSKSNLVHKYFWFAGMHEGNEYSGKNLRNRELYYSTYAPALLSWKKHSSNILQPVLLLGRYGLPNKKKISKFGQWAEKQGAIVLNIQDFQFEDKIKGPARLQGLFMRWQIPKIMKTLKSMTNSEISRDIVLYTDADVLFSSPLKESDMQKVLSKFKANEVSVLYSTEHRKVGVPFNTGVMFMHVSRFEKILPEVLNFGSEYNYRFPAYDQGWLNSFFQSNKDRSQKRGFLNIHWNWKIYWGGDKREPLLVHFHGPKPGRYAECLASKNMACLKNIPSRWKHYTRLLRFGFRADNGLYANETLKFFQKLTLTFKKDFVQTLL